MVQVKITWQAFNDRAPIGKDGIASTTLELNGVWQEVQNNTLLEAIYKATNLKSELADFGAYPEEVQLWESIEAVLPANRTHTSLSVGDTVQINRSYSAIAFQDGPTYKVADIGYELVGA